MLVSSLLIRASLEVGTSYLVEANDDGQVMALIVEEAPTHMNPCG